jgi:hypothetical protein
MGYACPVCDLPQHDAEHLAHHLAVTALTHGDDHEDWLDDHAPGWGEESPETLGERVAPHAAEVAHETVFEDTTGGDHTHDHDHGAGGTAPAPPSDSEAVQSALAEARRMREAVAGDDADADAEDDA